MKKRWIYPTLLIVTLFLIYSSQAESLFAPSKDTPKSAEPAAATTPTTSAAPTTTAPAATTTAPVTTSTAVQAATTPTTEPANKSGLEKFRDWFHNPTNWLSMGADVRFRYIYAPNIDSFNNQADRRDYHFTRYRFRYWTKTKINDDVDFNIRWTWEFRNWDEPRNKDRNFQYEEIMWDNFNLTVRNLFDQPLTMVAGRQDIVLGKGWLVCDGTPLDGSRTNFFDALRFTYMLPDKDRTLDMIYVFNRADEDAWLRPFHDINKHTTEQDEQGVIIYYTDKTNPELQKEAYFMYRNDNPVDVPPRDFRQYWSKKAEIYTIGGALSGPIAGSKNWAFRSEGAVQFGEKEGMVQAPSHALTGNQETMQAFGTVHRIDYNFNDPHKHQIHGAFEYLSGDDPDNNKNTAFDPMWGEWPQWSELYIYSYIDETMVAETTNLWRLNVGHSMNLSDNVTMSTDYHLLWADENTEKNRPHANGSMVFSNSGKFRGQLATWWLKYQLTKNIKGHFVVEYFIPGGYYAQQNHDNALWTRINVEYTF